MVAGAVRAFFEPGKAPSRVRLHFFEDPSLQLA
jgi:hypothetical protein